METVRMTMPVGAPPQKTIRALQSVRTTGVATQMVFLLNSSASSLAPDRQTFG